MFPPLQRVKQDIKLWCSQHKLALKRPHPTTCQSSGGCMIYALTTNHPKNYFIGQPNCTHITLMFWILFLFVSAKLEFCLGWCNIPASCSDCGYCVFHWKQRRKIILQQTLKKEWVPFLLLSSVKVFSYQRIIKKSQTVSMYCTEYRYRYKCCIWPSLIF